MHILAIYIAGVILGGLLTWAMGDKVDTKIAMSWFYIGVILFAWFIDFLNGE